ncbi:MAG: lactate racemase domain-containing protein [Acutalibacteraceae bacterium]|nr:lactate racemase domain-containing protein [Acutalibacteraceae bacterium]
MFVESESIIDDKRLFEIIKKSVEEKNLKKVLILPPDYTRMYSGAGKITNMYYNLLKENCIVDIMPALGTHRPVTKEESEAFFGKAFPYEKLIVHNWRKDVVKIGEVPSEFVKSVSEGLVETKIDVEINKRLLDKSYDLVISIGQVVPHEVVGMANYSKNIFVGCGGSSMINSSHMLGAFYGLERIMGRDFSPVRKVFDYAEENFIKDIPLMYVLTVTTTNEKDETLIHGIYIGRSRELFEMSVDKSQKMNMTKLQKPIKKAVVYLDPREFRSTWLGNKAVYRTRMAMEEGGELIVLAPEVKKFGEDDENDRLIRKYGYVGRAKVLELVKKEEDLKNNLSVAAHLIHGSSDGKFKVTYCTKHLTKEEVESVGFNYMPYDEAVKKYDPRKLEDGYNTVGGEEIYYISNPALGLWIV